MTTSKLFYCCVVILFAYVVLCMVGCSGWETKTPEAHTQRTRNANATRTRIPYKYSSLVFLLLNKLMYYLLDTALSQGHSVANGEFDFIHTPCFFTYVLRVSVCHRTATHFVLCVVGLSSSLGKELRDQGASDR